MVELKNRNSYKFLAVVNDPELYGTGRADTTTIREEADLSRGEVHHQYGTLEEKGLIEIERDADATPEGKPAVKVAVLTDLAKEEIDKGLLVEAEKELDREPDVSEMAAELEDVQEQLAGLRELAEVMEDLEEVAELVTRVEECEETVDELRGTLNDTAFPALRMLRTSVGRIEVALAEADIDVSSVEVSEAKERELLQRLEDERRA